MAREGRLVLPAADEAVEFAPLVVRAAGRGAAEASGEHLEVVLDKVTVRLGAGTPAGGDRLCVERDVMIFPSNRLRIMVATKSSRRQNRPQRHAPSGVQSASRSGYTLSASGVPLQPDKFLLQKNFLTCRAPMHLPSVRNAGYVEIEARIAPYALALARVPASSHRHCAGPRRWDGAPDGFVSALLKVH